MVALALEVLRAVRTRNAAGLPKAFVACLVLPLALLWLTQSYVAPGTSLWLNMLLTLALVIPMGPMVYRIVYQPLAEATVLVLLIVSVAVHFALTGLALVFFGAEGWRTPAFVSGQVDLGFMTWSAQSLFVVATCAILIVGLWLFFGKTLYGRAARHRRQPSRARLVGISTTMSGSLTFTLATAIGAMSGMLIAPITTVYYDTGFLIGLKGFVGAIIGGLASYPVAAAGSLLVGVLESFSSFWASAYKEVIVFTPDYPGSGLAFVQQPSRGRRGINVMNRILLIVFVVALAALPLVPATPEFWVTQLNYIGLASLVVLGLVLLTGVGGLTSFGQAASSAWAPHHGLPDHPVRRVAVAGPAGRPGADRRGRLPARRDHAAPVRPLPPLGTIAWGLSLYFLFGNIDWLGKHDGIAGIEPISIFGVSLASGRHIYFLIWAFVLLALLATRNLLNSRPGRAIRALKSGAGMAESMGVNTAAYKVVIFVWAALLACVSAGCMRICSAPSAPARSASTTASSTCSWRWSAALATSGARCWARPSSWC